MATKYYRRPMSHHFDENGKPKFKYTVDPVTGKHTIDPEHAKYLDYEIVTEEVPDPPPTFGQQVLNVLWTILKGILFIFAYGAAREEVQKRNRK